MKTSANCYLRLYSRILPKPFRAALQIDTQRVALATKKNCETAPNIRAPLNTNERFIGFLIEHYARDFSLRLERELVGQTVARFSVTAGVAVR